MLEIQERNRMGSGHFHVHREDAVLSVPEVRAEVRPDEILEGSFAIRGPEGEAVTGFVISSQLPMHVLTPEFSGTREDIGYRLDAKGFAPDDRVEGVFRILSDHGEYELPFHIRVAAGLPDSSLGPIRNLSHYVNLARTNWKEAVSVFYRKEFGLLAASEEAGGSESIYALYRGLAARQGNEHNVEEFLIAAGCKEPAVYEADCRELTLEVSPQDTAPIVRQIRVRRIGWGYSCVRVEVTGDFLAAGTQELRAQDYIEGTAAVSIAVDPLRLHAGRNYGHVILTPAFGETIEIPVTASRQAVTAIRALHRREQRQLMLQMMRQYLAFRGKKITSQEFTESMGSLVRRMQEADRLGSLTALYKIHYLLTVHRGQDALWELQALCRRQYGLDGPMPDYPMAQFDLEEDLTYSYRMYLTILCAQEVNPDSIEAVGIARDGTRAIEGMHRRNPDNFWITWLMLYANPDYSRRPSEMLRILQEHYRRGCRSPLLYMEIWQMVRISPTILYELGDLEQQVLMYAARNELLTDAVMVRVNDLAVRRKTFSRRLFRVLELSYASDLPEHRRKETLESICTLLIRGNMTDSRYHEWYRRGVEQELGITRLLDYFMLSLPREDPEPLPQIVLLYYSYQNTLPDPQTAHLYRQVMERREENPELYVRYAERIDRFTLEQLSQRRISTDLAYLYEQYLLTGRILSAEHAAAAVQAVFTCRIHTTQPQMHRAVLVYDHLLSEQYCPLADGIGYLPVYGEACRIFLEDDRGDRSTVSVSETVPHAERFRVSCETTRMMDYARLAPPLLIYDVHNAGFDLFLADTAGEITSGSADRWLALSRNEDVTLSRLEGLRRTLMDYYEAEGNDGDLCVLLRDVRPEGIGSRARGPLLRAMSAQGLYEKAVSWICRFGTDGVDADTLLRLSIGIRKERLEIPENVAAEMAHEAFAQGRYESGMLTVIADAWDGSTQELAAVRTAAGGSDLDLSRISRRMLTQLLFTGERFPDRSELIESCAQSGADDAFLADVLAQMSHEYFVNGEEMSPREFDRIADYGMNGVPLLDICRIAWLKDRSERSGETSERDQEITGLFLSDLTGQGVIFPFFRQFAGTLPGLMSCSDETLFEYRAGRPDPKAKVLFHYAAERGGIREPYAAKEMKEMYAGVYVTGFLLFFGEQIHYYITDDVQEKNVVESGTLGQDARIAVAGGDRFCCINEITMLTALGRDEEAIARMDEYGRKAFLTSRLFED